MAGERNATLEGVLSVLHTPLLENDRIDTVAFQRQIDWAFSSGADGVGMGMVSETLRLSSAERMFLVEQMVQAAGGRGIVFASVGAESTPQAVALAEHAEHQGCSAAMVFPPVVTAASSSQLFDYFAAVIRCVELPIIIQDASGYVGHPIPLEVSIRLLDQFGPERVFFKPEAAPLGPQLSALRDASGRRARIFEGSGGVLLIDCFRRGIVGTMPGVDLLDAIVAIWQALMAGDDQRAYELYFPVCAIVTLQLQAGLDGFLAIEKYLMVKRGLFATARRRGPVHWSLDNETAAEVDRLFSYLQNQLDSPSP